MQAPPPSVTQDYLNRCLFAASNLNVPVNQTMVTQPPVTTPAGVLGNVIKDISTAISKVLWQPASTIANPALQPLWDENEQNRALANAAQGNVLAFIERVNTFINQASNSGFQPPSNPFTLLAQYNSDRGGGFAPIQLASSDADNIVFNIGAYVDLLEAYNQGGVDLNSPTGFNSAQMSHVKLSFDGLGGSGNPAADILTFLPTNDQVAEQSLAQALSVLDFTKRVPYLLFTSDYSPVHNQPSQGTLVGWKKIPDASGYILTRREVFAARNSTTEVSNATLDAMHDGFSDYAQRYVLSFFDSIDPSNVYFFLDTDLEANEYYIYTLQAYQVKNNQQGAVFTVDVTPVSLTLAAKNTIGQTIRQMSNWPDYTVTGYNADGSEIRDYNDFQETISPWPAFAQYLYGDSTYDWLLAAANVRASITRNDNVTITRQYSYLNAHSQFLEAQADAGKLVKPTNVAQVVQNIQSSIQNFGVSQTIQLLLDETEISYFFEGRDPQTNPYFSRAGTVNTVNSPLFNMIGSSIDPETATLDLTHLASNMQLLLAQSTLTVGTQVLPGSSGAPNASPSEISIPDPSVTGTQMATGLQYINQLGNVGGDTVIDLTTYDGLSTLMRVIRILSDFGPGKQTPSAPPKNAPPPPPISILPNFILLLTGLPMLFVANGGSGKGYMWSITTNQSGATITQTGLYIAGQAAGVDTVRVTDPAGRYIEATVNVTTPPPPPTDNSDNTDQELPDAAVQGA
jgi:hypothetical protein